MGCLLIYLGHICVFALGMSVLIGALPGAKAEIYIGGVILYAVTYLFLFAGRGSNKDVAVSDEQREDDQNHR